MRRAALHGVLAELDSDARSSAQARDRGVRRLLTEISAISDYRGVEDVEHRARSLRFGGLFDEGWIGARDARRDGPRGS